MTSVASLKKEMEERLLEVNQDFTQKLDTLRAELNLKNEALNTKMDFQYQRVDSQFGDVMKLLQALQTKLDTQEGDSFAPKKVQETPKKDVTISKTPNSTTPTEQPDQSMPGEENDEATCLTRGDKVARVNCNRGTTGKTGSGLVLTQGQIHNNEGDCKLGSTRQLMGQGQHLLGTNQSWSTQEAWFLDPTRIHWQCDGVKAQGGRAPLPTSVHVFPSTNLIKKSVDMISAYPSFVFDPGGSHDVANFAVGWCAFSYSVRILLGHVRRSNPPQGSHFPYATKISWSMKTKKRGTEVNNFHARRLLVFLLRAVVAFGLLVFVVRKEEGDTKSTGYTRDGLSLELGLTVFFWNQGQN